MGFFKSDPFIKSIRELGRVVLMAMVPVLIFGVENGVVDWGLVGTVGLIAGLRWLDKLLHELGKENNNKVLIKGLTRF